MGIFSSKKKTYVGTSVSRLMDDDLLPDSQYAGAVKALFQDTPLVPTIQDELMAGLAMRAEQAYTYGSSARYLPGNPTGDFITNAIGKNELKEVLETLEGAPVLLDYFQCDCPNMQHIAWIKLIQEYGYDPATNKIEGLKAQVGTDVYLHDLVLVVPAGEADSYSPAALQRWGLNPKHGPSPSRPATSMTNGMTQGIVIPTPVVKSPTASQEYVKVEYAWVRSQAQGWRPQTPQVVIESFDIFLDEFDSEGDYFQVRYLCRDVPKYWIYAAGSGEHPKLDALLSLPPKTGGDFYPFIHFRKNKTSIKNNPELYKCSQKLASKFGIDYDPLLEAIHENPDVKDVQQAYLGLMVPANTNNSLEVRYLFDFFDQAISDDHSILLSPVSGKSIFTAAMGKLFAEKNRKSIVIRDKYMTMVFSTAGAMKYLSVGKIGPVGTYTLKYTKKSDYEKVHSYRRQVTENVFEEISILNLEMRYQVQGKYWVVGDNEEDILLIPVDRSIVKKYSLADRETLLARSLHLICNSLVVVKVKWYQRAGFKWIMRIVAVVILIYSWGQSWQLAGSFIAGATLAVQVLLTILIQVGLTMVVGYLFKFVAKELGQDFALTLAFIAAAVAGASNLSSTISAALNSVMLTAQRLLFLALSLVQGVTANIGDAIDRLSQEMAEFTQMAQDKWELLESSKKLLESPVKFDPFVVFGETPTQYFSRTIHAGNVGTIGFDLMHNHVDLALRLPTVSDTFGGLTYD